MPWDASICQINTIRTVRMFQERLPIGALNWYFLVKALTRAKKDGSKCNPFF